MIPRAPGIVLRQAASMNSSTGRARLMREFKAKGMESEIRLLIRLDLRQKGQRWQRQQEWRRQPPWVKAVAGIGLGPTAMIAAGAVGAGR